MGLALLGRCRAGVKQSNLNYVTATATAEVSKVKGTVSRI
jgi:hypothetical protein